MAINTSIISNNIENATANNSIETSTLAQTDNMDDGNTSQNYVNKDFTTSEVKNLSTNGSDIFSGIFHTAGIYKRTEVDLFHNRYRFGILNPQEALTSCREYLFFTKPDLNIYPRDDENGTPKGSLSDYLQTQSYWVELAAKNYSIIESLQSSLNSKDPFNHLLENMVMSNLDIPTISSEMIETPNNMYGVGYQYRGSSEASDDSFDFSLEFRDTKYLPVYHFFRAYEDYQTLKHHGQLPPWRDYIMNKILYDQYSVYKFMVDEDGESIIYYAKLYGVKSKSLPREVFSNTAFDNGISYTIDFNAAFFEDMKPTILTEFNNLAKTYCDSLPYQIDIHNHVLDRADNRAAKCAYISKEKSNIATGGFVYKLKWRGDAKY